MRLRTVAEAASWARVSERTVRRAIRARRHRLRSYHVGRRVLIDEADLEEWVRGHALSTASKAPVDRLSTSARELLEGLGRTLSAPSKGRQARSAASSEAYGTGPSDSVSARPGKESIEA